MSHETLEYCHELQPRLAAYALGEPATDPELQAHLATCSRCAADLRSYMKVARVLPYSAPLLDPPPALRDRVLANATGAPVPPQPAPKAPRAWRWARVWPGVALAMIVGLLGWNIALQRQLSTRNALLNTSRERWVTVTRILNDREVRSAALQGEQATAHVWFTPGSQEGCLVAQQLPPLSAGNVYQVWFTDGARRISGGTFEPIATDAWTIVRADQPISAFTSMGITVEPRGGSPAPTSPPVLRANLSAAAAPSLAARDLALKFVQTR